jgi:hypothetical protein
MHNKSLETILKFKYLGSSWYNQEKNILWECKEIVILSSICSSKRWMLKMKIVPLVVYVRKVKTWITSVWERSAQEKYYIRRDCVIYAGHEIWIELWNLGG